MNICDNITPPKQGDPVPIPGHIYRCEDITTDFGKLAIAVRLPDDNIKLVSLQKGTFWSHRSTFGIGTYLWYDVTELYCLTKLK
jgi:hypothetical protein